MSQDIPCRTNLSWKPKGPRCLNYTQICWIKLACRTLYHTLTQKLQRQSYRWYTLVNIAGCKMDRQWRCNSYWTWGYSIAMLVYQKVVVYRDESFPCWERGFLLRVWPTTKTGAHLSGKETIQCVAHEDRWKNTGKVYKGRGTSWNCNFFWIKRKTGWWFQIFFIFTPIWGNDPIWLIFFHWVETTNQWKAE